MTQQLSPPNHPSILSPNALRDQVVLESISINRLSPFGSPRHSPALLPNSPPFSPGSTTLNGYMSSPQRVIAIALDSSVSGRNAFHWALANLLSPLTDLVTLLHVRPGTRDPNDAIFADFGDYLVEAELEEQEKSRNLLRAYATRLTALGFSVRAIALRGEFGPELVRKANEINATTMVVGSGSKRNKLVKLLMGSVSDYCVQNCNMPVVVVRQDMAEGLGSPVSSASGTPRSIHAQSPAMPAMQ